MRDDRFTRTLAEAWEEGHKNCRCACNHGANWTHGGLACPACTNPYRADNTTDRTYKIPD